MNTKIELARKAYTAAIQERKRAGVGLTSAICVFDLIHKAGVEIRFKNLSSMEGLYYNNGKPLILISSCRPRGRVAFNCTHEYAHHIFDHGDRIDEAVDSISESKWEPEEFLADCFAGFFLMPKIAVSKAFAVRGWNVDECTPEQAFIVSGYMGVGYKTLLTHMYYSLKVISHGHFNQLDSLSPKLLKNRLTSFDHTEEVVLLDKHWEAKSVDLCVGDILIVPPETIIEESCMEFVTTGPNGLIYKAIAQGIDRAQNELDNWASYIRVSRLHFEGLVQYRHFPEVDHE